MYERRFRAAMALCGRSYSYDRNDGRRWLNRDPIGEAGGLNLNAYVGNNPISGIDPFGLDATTDQIHAYKFQPKDFGPAPSRNSMDAGFVKIDDNGNLVAGLDDSFQSQWSDEPIVLNAALAHEQVHIQQALNSGSTVGSKCNAGQYLGTNDPHVEAVAEYQAYEAEDNNLTGNANNPNLSIDDKIAIGQRVQTVEQQLAHFKQQFIDTSPRSQ